jgi:hypothetical protein
MRRFFCAKLSKKIIGSFKNYQLNTKLNFTQTCVYNPHFQVGA